MAVGDLKYHTGGHLGYGAGGHLRYCDDACSVVTTDITSGTPVWFDGGASLAAGNYTVEYLLGAFSYDLVGGQTFRINADAFSYIDIVTDDGMGGYTSLGTAPGDTTQRASQALTEAANSGATTPITHSGGRIGIRLVDFPYGDNELDLADPDPLAPTFELCPA